MNSHLSTPVALWVSGLLLVSLWLSMPLAQAQAQARTATTSHLNQAQHAAQAAQRLEQAGQTQNAARYWRQALWHGQYMDMPSLQWRWQWQLGRNLSQNASAEATTALGYYQQALTNLQRLREAGCETTTLRASQLKPFYLEYVELLLQQAKPAALRQVQAVWESYKLAELDELLLDTCLRPKSQLSDLVDQHTVVVYPLLLPDRLELLISVGQQIRHYSVASSAQQLQSLARRLGRQLRQPNSHQRGWQRQQRALQRRLLHPWQNWQAAAEAHTLVFIADGALQGLPLAALLQTDNPQAVVISPGLQLTESAKAAPAPQRLLAGMSQAWTDPQRSLPALPGVARELQTLQQRWGGELLLDQDFSQQALRQSLRGQQVQWIHLATHAAFAGDQSYVLTWDGPLPLTQLRHWLGSRRLQPQPLDLLTLSACETAVGDEQAALGLAGAAIQAGARSVVASLWPVDDQATAQFMQYFYHQLHTDPHRARALRTAQQQMALGQYAHPFYWAGFVLIGQWQ